MYSFFSRYIYLELLQATRCLRVQVIQVQGIAGTQTLHSKKILESELTITCVLARGKHSVQLTRRAFIVPLLEADVAQDLAHIVIFHALRKQFSLKHTKGFSLSKEPIASA